MSVLQTKFVLGQLTLRDVLANIKFNKIRLDLKWPLGGDLKGQFLSSYSSYHATSDHLDLYSDTDAGHPEFSFSLDYQVRVREKSIEFWAGPDSFTRVKGISSESEVSLEFEAYKTIEIRSIFLKKE